MLTMILTNLKCLKSVSLSKFHFNNIPQENTQYGLEDGGRVMANRLYSQLF